MLWHRGLSPPHCLSKVQTLNPKVLLAPAAPPEFVLLGCFSFILAFWALLSFHFGLLGLDFLHFFRFRLCVVPFWAFAPWFPFNFAVVEAARRHFSILFLHFLTFWVASGILHPRTTLGRNRFFCWPALWHQPNSILKGRRNRFFAGRLVASTQLHPQRTLGRNRFFAGPPCGINPAPSSKDPWPKPIFCWPALWHQPSSILKGPLAATDFLLASLVTTTQLHPQRTLGRNRFFAGPPCGINPAPSSKHPWPKPIFLRARLVASTQLYPQRTLGRNRFFAGPPCGIGPSPSSRNP